MWRRKRTVLDEFDEMDRRMDEFYRRMNSLLEPMWDIPAQTLKPLYEVRQTRDLIKILVDLPYVEREAVRLKVNEDSVDISAELRKPIRYDHWGTIQRGCEFKQFSVTIPLPTEVDPDVTKAKLKDGVLAVDLIKKAKRSTVKID